MDMGLHRMRWKIGLNHREQENFQRCTAAAVAAAAVAAVTHDAFTLAFALFLSQFQAFMLLTFCSPRFWMVLLLLLLLTMMMVMMMMMCSRVHTCKDKHTYIHTRIAKAHLMRRVREQSVDVMAWHG